MAAVAPLQPQLAEDNRISCWVCFATEEDDLQAAWVRPCRCRGTTKWVHRACLQRWVDEKQHGDVMAKVSCPQCNTEYLINFPSMGPFLRTLNLTDRIIYKLCPFVAGGIFIGSVYWTAVTYGAISVMQVLGHKEGLAVMERADPLFLLIGLPTIPVGLVLGKMVRWEDCVLNFIRRQSAKVSLLQEIMQLPAGQQVARVPVLPPLNDPLSATRVLCGALVMPTIATIIGKLFFPQVQNNLHRSIMGGISFTLVKGALKIYHKQQQYIRQVNREIQDYPEEEQNPVQNPIQNPVQEAAPQLVENAPEGNDVEPYAVEEAPAGNDVTSHAVEEASAGKDVALHAVEEAPNGNDVVQADAVDLEQV